MFYKFQSFYRQFAQFSIRLLNRKLSSTSIAVLQPIKNNFNVTNSPLRTKNRTGILKGGGVILAVPFERRIQNFQQLQSEHLNLLIKKTRPHQSAAKKEISPKFADTNEFTKLKSACSNPNHNSYHNFDVFPLLTGDELKAFDSSVFE